MSNKKNRQRCHGTTRPHRPDCPNYQFNQVRGNQQHPKSTVTYTSTPVARPKQKRRRSKGRKRRKRIDVSKAMAISARATR